MTRPCRTLSEWIEYEHQKELQELQNIGYDMSSKPSTEQEYELQNTVAEVVKDELIRKYQKIGIPLKNEKIIKLKNERTGTVEFRKVKK